ncbi:MAG: FkbM family methyltransferase [Pseudomonadota bacterium]
MANATWKNIEKSPPYQRFKVRLKQLVGKELKVTPDVCVDCVTDGGWSYDNRLLNEDSIVYSLGVGDFIDFDLGVIQRCGSQVFAFDPTPVSRSHVGQTNLPEQFHFYAWAAAGEDGTLTLYPRVKNDGTLSTDMFTLQPEPQSANAGIESPALTIQTMAEKLGHTQIDLLKMDIEGAEYDVIDALLASSIRPRQILIEFHHRFMENGLQRTADYIEALRRENYQVMSVCQETGREIGFLLRR